MATGLLVVLALLQVFCSGASAKGAAVHDFEVIDPSADTGIAIKYCRAKLNSYANNNYCCFVQISSWKLEIWHSYQQRLTRHEEREMPYLIVTCGRGEWYHIPFHPFSPVSLLNMPLHHSPFLTYVHRAGEKDYSRGHETLGRLHLHQI